MSQETRPTLPAAQLSSTALAASQAFFADTIAEIQTAIGRDAVVVVGMAQNPFVKKARKALEAAGISFTYLEYGSYFGEWKRRLAIKMWSGWPTFPQVYVKGTLIGGFSETTKELADGSLKKRLG
ncbi:MAG TPA: glutaredoxin [Pseudomonadota bacterium]|nr:glutaredoxin [Pseudomonadota bacterium]